MPYIAPEVITEAKRMDLLTYLREYEPGELVKFSSNTYTTRTHDSLKISNGKWMWWSRGIGGKSALDYLIKVRGMDFVQAVQTIMGNGSVSFPTCKNIKSYEEQPLLLPQKSPTTEVVFDYLFGRGIDYEIINHCLEQELIIESLPYHNAVFIGYDENKEPKYAAYRATNQSRIMGDCTGSKKQYSFRLTAENTGEVHLFECAIDLLSYATLMKLEGKDWRQFNLVSLAGVYSPKQKIEDSKVPVTLGRLLEKDKTIRRIVLHLDNDIAGRKATKALQTILSDKYEVVDDAGQIHMSWENGSSLALNIHEDTFEKVEAPEKISVILVEPGRYPKLIEIEDTLEAMQSLVEGDIEEYMPFEDEVAIICNEEGKMNGMPLNRAVYSEPENVEMSYPQLKAHFRQAEKERNHTTGYIVFTDDSFDKPYTEEQRTYVVSSNNKAFIEGMGGYSIYASSLDGSDKCVRLEAYMADEHGGKDGWKIEKCYVKDDSNREMLDIIAGKFFIAYAPIESEKFLSMPKELARKYEEKFKYPERFYKSLDGIEAKPYKPVSKDMER